MQTEPAHFPATPVALKMAVAIGIGMLAGMEREWSNKDVGIRTFAIVALLGTLASIIGTNVAITSLIGVFLLVAAMNARSILADRSLEITTSAALILNYLLGVLVGLGHIFTPVAGAIVMTMLLAWKTELRRFAGDLQPFEIRSAVLLGLIGFVIYPVLPNRYIDPWQLFNPSDAWISVIAIAGIGFVNYVFLRVYRTRGLYLGALFGGLVNSSATMLATGIFGGLVSSASTTAAAATMAMHGKISPALAGSTTILASLASAVVNLPIVWRTTKSKAVMKRLTIELATVLGVGVAAVVVDRTFQFSEILVRK